MLTSPGQVQVFPPAFVEGYEQVRAVISISHKDLVFPQLLLHHTLQRSATSRGMHAQLAAMQQKILLLNSCTHHHYRLIVMRAAQANPNSQSVALS